MAYDPTAEFLTSGVWELEAASNCCWGFIPIEVDHRSQAQTKPQLVCSSALAEVFV